MLDDAGLVEAIVAAERNVAHRLDRGVHAAGQRDGGGAPREDRHARPLPRARDAGSAEGRDSSRSSSRRSGTRCRPTAASSSRGHFQRLVEKIRRQARGEAHRVPDAAHDAEGAVRPGEPRALRPGGRGLHALHVADSPLSRPGRASRAARVAAGCRRGAPRRIWRRTCRRWRRHTSERERRAADAERELVQWKKVRFMADKVGDEFEGYITGVSAYGLYLELVEHFVEGMVHVSTMADDYYRFVEARARAARARTTAASTGWAIASRCRSFASTSSGGRSISGCRRSWMRCASRRADRGPVRARRGRRARERRGEKAQPAGPPGTRLQKVARRGQRSAEQAVSRASRRPLCRRP